MWTSWGPQVQYNQKLGEPINVYFRRGEGNNKVVIHLANMIQQLEGSDTAKLLLGYLVKSSTQLNQSKVQGTLVISKLWWWCTSKN